MRELRTEQDALAFEESTSQSNQFPVLVALPSTQNTDSVATGPVNRLGTAHRIETLRHTGILSEHYGTVVDIGGYDGAICTRISADERIVVEPYLPDESLRYPNVKYIQSDGASAPLPDSSVDLAIMLDVLEHVDQPADLVAEAVRILKPGGKGVITVPSSDIRIFPWFLQNWADRRWDHTIRRGYRPEQIEREIKTAGGEVVRSLDMGCTGFRLTYLPVSILWRAWQSAARRLLNVVSRLDYRFRNIGSGRGYIFIEFRKAA